MKTSLSLMLSLLAVNTATRCTDIAGTMKQIDAGIGMVFGVNYTGSVYTRLQDSWIRIPGTLKHITVGPAGVWGVDHKRKIFRMTSGTLNPIFNGELIQLDAGGERILAGVDQFGSTFCINSQDLAAVTDNKSATFNTIGSRMRYYSCGPLGCWGVTLARDVYYRLNVKPSACIGTSWTRVFGKFQNIEVGSDGRVFGISVTKQLYMRKGISVDRPTGWGWTKIQIGNLQFNHASWDLGHLWLVRTDGKIVKCSSDEID
ncbi:fish-egg lectin-like [Scyliorhinus canicula]|uniref:fish-egg lectin-like n=1 Tax=Scyliorhinus canicula TaxID=7830 RepID=UPI0018F7B93D|nr:fish-egg lectin-like [Scyliorhinus canicula]XP_038669523.1 fish-egg lectin-like [Scyliorhinus canicula]XP_038669524.1 fish-egg lectin-like [Scyliorhinus canicula]XP_038669525.1 fish-egg lectin-like [Scyliorhinus canicula]